MTTKAKPNKPRAKAAAYASLPVPDAAPVSTANPLRFVLCPVPPGFAGGRVSMRTDLRRSPGARGSAERTTVSVPPDLRQRIEEAAGSGWTSAMVALSIWALDELERTHRLIEIHGAGISVAGASRMSADEQAAILAKRGASRQRNARRR